MNVPKKVMIARRANASDLLRFATLLDKAGLCDNTYLIQNAANTLKNKSSSFHTPGKKDYKCWGYNIEGLELKFQEFPKRHVRPKNIKSLKVEVDVNLLCNHENWDNQKDPLIEMNFRARVIGSDLQNEYAFGFHIDKHNSKVVSDELHPLYHIHFDPLINRNESALGLVLSLDTPRIMHVPVDLILGIDLVLSNFAPKSWEKLREQSGFDTLYKKYQDYIWKPYVHAWATHWTYDQTRLGWNNSFDICPYLLS